MVNWKSSDSHQRLLAALVASLENQKPDYRKIATYYGENATYDAIEGRFRLIRKEAQKLKDEVSSGNRPEAPKRGDSSSNPTTPRKPRTPKKNVLEDGVASGRISKKQSSSSFSSSASNTPTKRRPNKTPIIKTEILDLTGEESFESSSTSVDTPTSSMMMEQTTMDAAHMSSDFQNQACGNTSYLETQFNPFQNHGVDDFSLDFLNDLA